MITLSLIYTEFRSWVLEESRRLFLAPHFCA